MQTPRVTKWTVLGAVGSCLVALGATGAGVLPQPDPLRHAPVLEQLRSGTGTLACIALAAAGMLLLVIAWLALGREIATEGDDPRCTPRRLWFVAAVWALPLALAPPILSRDVYAYAAAGDLLQHRMNPYEHGAADLPSQFLSSTSQSWYHVPFAYGPLFLLLACIVVTLAGGHLVAAVFGMRLVAALGCVLLGAFLPRLARSCGVDPRGALWLGMVNPLVLAHFVGGAHADAIMVGLLVAGLALATERRVLSGVVPGTVLATLAVAVKATAAVALPFVALLWAQLRRQNRPGQQRGAGPLIAGIALTTLVAAATFAAMTAAAGVGYGWVNAVSTVGLSVQWTSVSTGLGLAAGFVGRLLGFGDHTEQALSVTRPIGLAAAAVVLVWLWLRALRAGSVRGVVLPAGWALLALVLLSPVVHPWYLLWGVAVLAAAGVDGRARLVVVAGCAALCFLVLPDGYNLARATVPFGVTLDVLVVLCGAGYLLLRRGSPGGTRLRGKIAEKIRG